MNEQHMLPEHAARSILARATELDAESPSISVDELRAIAAELNVSEAALDTALREYQAVTPGRPPMRQWAPLAVAALGLPIGVVGGCLLSAATMFTAPSLWLLVTAGGLLSSTGLIVLQSKRPSVNSFVLQNSLLWGGIAAGAAAALTVLGQEGLGAPPWVVVLFYALRHWLPTTILGAGAATALLRADSARGRDPDAPLLAGEPRGPRTRRLLDWLKAPFTARFAATPGAPLRPARPAPAAGATA